ncbi:MAG: cell division FtsZ family protein [Candidatus Coatesbacteria bacterium]|nr:cell division FtsZ family protein [Candidatus Coatesbacteria bacterium]
MGSIAEIVLSGVSFGVRPASEPPSAEWPFVRFGQEEDCGPQAKVLVAGVGGDGCNLVEQMHSRAVGPRDFIAIDTDHMSLQPLAIEAKLLLGKETTKSIGSGGNAELGKAAAQETSQEWAEIVSGYRMVLLAAGMGGGTGSGAAAHLAKIAKGAGALTVAVVTSPFEYEGQQKAESAAAGIAELRKSADSIIVIPNDKIFSLTNEITYYEALKLRDELLTSIMSSVTDLVLLPTRMAIDFGSIRAVIADGGMMSVSMATATGENKVNEILEKLLHNSLLDHPPLAGAQAILLVTTLGYKVMASEAKELKSIITGTVSPRAKIFCGARLDERAGDTITATLIATHFDELLERQGDVVELDKVFTIDEINTAGLSHRIHIPSYKRLKTAAEGKERQVVRGSENA